MADYLLLTDHVPRISDGERGRSAWGLAQGLLAAGHRVTLLTAAPAEAAARVPGMARRLRKLQATVGTETLELGLFEGRFSSSDPQLLVVETPDSLPDRAQFMGAAAQVLVEQGLRADGVLAWGEAAAPALERIAIGTRFFVLPDGKIATPSHPPAGTQSMEPTRPVLAAVGANAAHAVVVPSATSARALKDHPALVGRASDEPIVTIRFGCGDVVTDPATDQVLPARFSASEPAGKSVCRQSIARRLSLAIEPHTLLLAAGPLSEAAGSDLLLQALAQKMPANVAVVFLSDGEGAMVERANLLSIEHPTSVALLRTGTQDKDDLRRVLAAADAVALTNGGDWTGMEAGLALRYGAIPLAPLSSSAPDQLVDIDEASGTGFALFYDNFSTDGLSAAIVRAAALRGNATLWPNLVRGAMLAAPRWRDTAEIIEGLRRTFEAGLDQKLAV